MLYFVLFKSWLAPEYYLIPFLSFLVGGGVGLACSSDGKRIWLHLRRPRLDPWVGKTPQWREWQPILAWRIPWTEKTCGLQSPGSQRVGTRLEKDWYYFFSGSNTGACLFKQVKFISTVSFYWRQRSGKAVWPLYACFFILFYFILFLLVGG